MIDWSDSFLDGHDLRPPQAAFVLWSAESGFCKPFSLLAAFELLFPAFLKPGTDRFHRRNVSERGKGGFRGGLPRAEKG